MLKEKKSLSLRKIAKMTLNPVLKKVYISFQRIVEIKSSLTVFVSKNMQPALETLNLSDIHLKL